jgi:glycogen(starch) synthase
MKVPKADVLLEASWEVCNKVGGIYTVVTSKAALLKEYYNNYFLIGPYFENKAKVECELLTSNDPLCRDMAAQGIKVYRGKWLIKGEPNVILIDFSSLVARKDEIKKKLWDLYKIDSLFSSWDFEEPVLWAWAVGMVIERLSQDFQGKKIVGHFHEWMAGAGILYLKSKNSSIHTVFTTHATILGRTIAESGNALYEILPNINPDQEAANLHIMDKFTTERACAKNADIFTTVSEITGIEAEKLLDRKPDVLTLNGLDMSKFPNYEEMVVKHVESRDTIREFISYYFFPYYHFDIERNLIFYILGRYEFRNKGIDILIKSLGKLNEMLKEGNVNRTITCLFFIPNEQFGIKMELLENKNFYREIKNFISRHENDIQKQMVNALLTKGQVTSEDLFTKDFLHENVMKVMSFKKKGTPSFVTHYLRNEDNDAIISNLKANGLDNKEDDKVKVICYPVYLNGVDGLIDLNYYDTIIGCHLGIFPSYYEPYGYTPLESAALGVPAITTDLSGFGMFIQKKSPIVNKSGLFVMQRLGKTEQQMIDELSGIMFNYAKLDRGMRVKSSIDGMALAGLADWKDLIENYIEAHNRALDK